MTELTTVSFECGWCDRSTGGSVGYKHQGLHCDIYFCRYCRLPTVRFLTSGDQWVWTPLPASGQAVAGLPPIVGSAWDEARATLSAGAPTAAALMCRKILMNVAVDKGAAQNLRFVQYVDWLSEHHFIPPHIGDLTVHIKDSGNDATHEIVSVDQKEAAIVLGFTQSLLQIVYEIPSLLPPDK